MLEKIIKSHNVFWKELWEAQKVTNMFVKKHWKGYIVLCVGTGIVTFGTVTLIEHIENKKFEKSYSAKIKD
jgi:hypothetical protein